MSNRPRAATGLAYLLETSILALGCTGVVDSPNPAARAGGSGASSGIEMPMAGPAAREDLRWYGNSGVRRLSKAEYRASVQDILGVDVESDLGLLPTDPLTPFDNAYREQVASAALIEGFKALADRAASRVVSDPAARAALLPCTPAGAADSACLSAFAQQLGMRLFRRPLTPEAIASYAAAATTLSGETGDFFDGVEVVLRAMLQDLRFLYRIEIGTPVTGSTDLVRLDGYEVASRLSYLLWGTAPDAALLGAAADGTLATEEGIGVTARALLAAPQARARLQRFHAMWLGYEKLPHVPELSAAMKRETDALVARVVFEESRPWTELFAATETFLDADLAAHYGLMPPLGSGPSWVSYGDTGRQGILSHGSLLSNGAKFGDTSPVQRGLFVRRMLMCQEIPPPPPDLNVNVDEPPMASAGHCKSEAFAAHATGGCAACHDLIDPLGFGLENYDAVGRFRTHENDRPDCPIPGDGHVDGMPFNGPGQLGARLVESGTIGNCFVEKFFAFAAGRKPETADASALDALAGDFTATSQNVPEVLVRYVTAPAFRHRVIEPALAESGEMQ